MLLLRDLRAFALPRTGWLPGGSVGTSPGPDESACLQFRPTKACKVIVKRQEDEATGAGSTGGVVALGTVPQAAQTDCGTWSPPAPSVRVVRALQMHNFKTVGLAWAAWPKLRERAAVREMFLLEGVCWGVLSLAELLTARRIEYHCVASRCKMLQTRCKMLQRCW